MSPTNDPPIADAGPDQTVEQDGHTGGSVTLDGSGSTDDGQLQPLTYTWTWTGGSEAGVSPTVILPLGTTTVTLTVYDGELSDTDTVDITVVDTTPPEIDLNLLTDTLWPPNHKMVKVAEISATDICDEAPLFTVDITSNESINGPSDGNTNPDWEWDAETGELYLRAERSGKGDGRVYTITVTATDASENSAAETAQVTVPHDKRKGKK